MSTTTTHPDLSTYDHIIVAFSGGKDSLACLLTVLEMTPGHPGIELWHHEIDGREAHFMDWPITPSYCQAVASAFGLPLFFQWKKGGFKGELLRDAQPTAATCWQQPDGSVGQAGGNGKPGTRLLFPQTSASLSTRWCSAYLKIDVCTIAIRNQDRFNHSRTIVITGERAEESTNRSHYATFEPHKADARNGRLSRHVDQWRPVHGMDEAAVWQLIEKHQVLPHPAYYAGYSRVSCMHCIFADPDQVASSQMIDPDGIQVLAQHEAASGKTIHRSMSLGQRSAKGTPYATITTELAQLLMSTHYTRPIFAEPGQWVLPAGAFGKDCGPV